MKKKIYALFASVSLLVGLAACNFGDDQAENHNEMDISAADTSTPSNQYPHTKAILVQDAKYKFVQVDPNQPGDVQKKLHEEVRKQLEQFSKMPNQRIAQGPNQAPVEQPKTQTPAKQPQYQTPAKQPQYQAPAKQPQYQAPAKEQPKQAQEQPQKEQPKETKGISQYAQRVIDLTNQERANAGLPALKADAQLSKVAQVKSEDMQKNNYFSHTSPTYGSPFDMMRDFGISYKTAGENIAQGQRTPEEVVNAWMNSAGHRKNILSEQFTHIGVGYESQGNHWTQMFIGK